MLRFWNYYHDSTATLPKLSFGYLLVSVWFVTFGGIFATAWGENSARKCLYIGLTFPVMVSALAQKLSVR
jgi:hypothetical protein